MPRADKAATSGVAVDALFSPRADNQTVVQAYVDAVLSGAKVAGEDQILACKRYIADLANVKDYDFRREPADQIIEIIETQFLHSEGESLDGRSLKNTPFLLEPWEKFIVYNLMGFFHAGTQKRRYTEAFIFIPRKNGKTQFVAALTWAMALYYAPSGSNVYIIGSALRQAMQSFSRIVYNVRRMDEDGAARIIDNNAQHSIGLKFLDEAGNEAGSIYIEALAANPDRHDSLISNLQICDELHAYKNAKQYNVIKEAGKAYTNKLCFGVTTAGDDMTSFCYQRLKYCQKVLRGLCADEAYFIFICKADEDAETGEVDYTNPIQHQKANPNYGVTIRPEDIANDAMQALNDPQQRKDFLAKSLNVYTSSMRSYFNLAEFSASDAKYDWTLEQLAKLPIKWYGGADLSKLHDLTAAVLYGQYDGVDIIIPHAWFPITAAYRKADEDNIPLFGWQDDGWLTMSNNPTVNHAEIVNWFVRMRKAGFNIAQVGHDRKFCREYFIGMKKAGFKIVDQPQNYYKKSEGFRHIEVAAKNGNLYYLHSAAYEYCVQNVRAIEKTDDMVQYEKVEDNQRIDIFDASVFACLRMIECMQKSQTAKEWLSDE